MEGDYVRNKRWRTVSAQVLPAALLRYYEWYLAYLEEFLREFWGFKLCSLEAECAEYCEEVFN